MSFLPTSAGPARRTAGAAGGALITALVAVAAATGSATLPSAAAAEPIRFNRDIRPILSDNCYFCHGPDRNKRKAGLRLDTEAGLFGSNDGTIPVLPGEPERSEVYQRIVTDDPDDLMPAPGSGKRLTTEQIALLKRWIAEGAPWEGHWAYTAPQRPPVPQVQTAGWPRNPIDHFILARLEAERLNPSPPADRRTLLRRLSFDLTGLPPAPEELAAFATDAAPGAVDRVVERLLASPRFGERLASYWLDLVRYADTDGYHGDNYRSVWPYRDYVVQAFNANVPFDRFTREQLAGDLLPEATVTQKIASTYNRLGRTTEEGGAQAKEYLIKYAADRVRTTASVWLGSTLACAECHDHKFDPFSARDFYRFAAFFADVKEQGVAKPEPVMVPGPAEEAELARLDRLITDLQRQLETPTEALARTQTQWEEHLRAELAEGRGGWQVIRPAEVVSANGATLTVLDDHSVLAGGENPKQDTYTITLETGGNRVTAVRLEALTHPSLANKSLSRANGNFVLTGVEIAAAPAEAPFEAVPIASALADFSQPDYPVAAAIDDRADTGWAVNGHNQAQDRQAAFVLAQPIAAAPGSRLRIRLKHDSQFDRHNIGRFRLALISVEHPTLGPEGLPGEIARALRVPAAERTPDQAAAVAKHYRGIAPALDPVRAQLAAAQKEKETFLATVPRTLATLTTTPREVRVLPRGDWLDDSGEVVTPAVPEFLAPASAAAPPQATRLDLADWLVTRDNPLSARVFVNRLWKLFFGTGISRVLDDLGSQGEWPAHPELLDWLAVEFMESGWDVKHVVRQMVTSQTYQQSSQFAPRLRERDPQNRLLARQSRFRLEAEMVRDNALAISSLLVEQPGGPSVKPYQPPGYWAQLNFPKREWEPDQGPALYRRTLYTFWCRTFLHPTLAAFDAPSREECTAERTKSNTPQQALTLLNDPIFVEAARVFAERILRTGGATPADRMEWAFARALTRAPEPAERELLRGLLDREQQRYAGDPQAAAKLIATGEWPVPADLDPVELAAWTSVARVMLNLHETIARF